MSRRVFAVIVLRVVSSSLPAYFAISTIFFFEPGSLPRSQNKSRAYCHDIIGDKLLAQEHSYFCYSKLVVFDDTFNTSRPPPALNCVLANFFLCFHQPNLFSGWDDEADMLRRAESLNAESDTQRVPLLDIVE